MKILGTGSALPKRVLTNDELALMVDTSDQWIRSRCGIVARRIAESETTLSLARDAAKRALTAASIAPEQIDLVICATLSNEVRCPPLACSLQRDLGLRNNILAFDLNAACSGFIYALISAEQLLGNEGVALVLGSEVLSRLTDFTDRNTCVLFGDGAGAAVIAANEQSSTWVSKVYGDDTILNIQDYIYMDGPAVFKFAVDTLSENIREVVYQAQLSLAEIPLFICHQANQRILASAAKRLEISPERFFMNLADYGNTSAASIPLALDDAVRADLLQPGMPVVIAGFGGGLSSGALCMIWT